MICERRDAALTEAERRKPKEQRNPSSFLPLRRGGRARIARRGFFKDLPLFKGEIPEGVGRVWNSARAFWKGLPPLLFLPLPGEGRDESAVRP
jgi:hypothetical protein